MSSAVSCDAALTHRHQGQGGAGSSRGVRSLKYVLHCRHNHEHDPEQYLTPTQRAARRIRELKVSEGRGRSAGAGGSEGKLDVIKRDKKDVTFL